MKRAARPVFSALQRDDDTIEAFNDDVFATLAMTSLLVDSRN
ncbi:MAG: hypothetical protein ACREPY_08260 [Rhodanobacteraceae bacterium]